MRFIIQAPSPCCGAHAHLRRLPMEQVREQQRAPPRSIREQALVESMDLLDETVRLRNRWDGIRGQLAAILDRGAFGDDAMIARGEPDPNDSGSNDEGGHQPSSAPLSVHEGSSRDSTPACTPTKDSVPSLVSPAHGSIQFVSCIYCGAALSTPMVCAGCHGVSYCSPACQHKDTHHKSTCSDVARYMQTNVRVSLDPEAVTGHGRGDRKSARDPEWLRSAMDHQCDASFCSVLQEMGVHEEEAYQLLCGCTGPMSPHRAPLAPSLPWRSSCLAAPCS